MSGVDFFDRRAARYERARPQYPAELWQRLRGLDVLRPRSKVLEIGAGTGEATQVFVDAGAEVTAVEPGIELARRLRLRSPGATVVRSRFEEAELDESAYDVACSATALHWLDLDVALPKLHRALVPGGLLAVWWTTFGDPSVRTEFRDLVDEIVARRTPSPRRHPSFLDGEAWLALLGAGGYFAPLEHQQFRWGIRLSAAQIRDLFGTFSNWSNAEVDDAARAVDRLGGAVDEHYVTALLVCRATR